LYDQCEESKNRPTISISGKRINGGVSILAALKVLFLNIGYTPIII